MYYVMRFDTKLSIRALHKEREKKSAELLLASDRNLLHTQMTILRVSIWVWWHANSLRAPRVLLQANFPLSAGEWPGLLHLQRCCWWLCVCRLPRTEVSKRYSTRASHRITLTLNHGQTKTWTRSNIIWSELVSLVWRGDVCWMYSKISIRFLLLIHF